MNQPTSSYNNRRTYKNERYLRSEHLLSGGKFVSVTWTVKDIIWDCPAKRMGAKSGEDATSKMPAIEFEEAPGYCLGLCKTNESLASIATGEGHPAKWKGKKLQLVVRIIADKKTKTDIPCIRVWPQSAVKLGRLIEQMGKRVEDEFYADNPVVAEKPAAPVEPEKKPEQPAVTKPPEMSPAQREFNDWAMPLVKSKAVTHEAVAAAVKAANGNYAEARKSIEASLEPTEAQTAIANTQAELINKANDIRLLEGFKIGVADYLAKGELTAHQAELLQGMIADKLKA